MQQHYIDSTGSSPQRQLLVRLPDSQTPGAQGEYETVAALATAQVLGATGATGDYLSGLLVTPSTVSPGSVDILDGATSYRAFYGGTNSVGSLIPFFIPIGSYSATGAWKVTTGSNVTVWAVGNFT